MSAPGGAGRARMARYALWQLRDYVVERGLPTLIAASPVFILMVTQLRGQMAVGRSTLTEDQLRGVVLAGLAESFTQIVGFVIVLLATNGMVANDRKMGYYRFLFAKPVTIPRYYAQTFVVNGVGAVLASAVITAVVSATLYPVFPSGVLAYIGLYYLMLGGLAFLLSTVTTLDWISVAGVWALSTVLRAAYPAEHSWYGALFNAILPPTHEVTRIGRSLIMGADPSPVAAMISAAGGGAPGPVTTAGLAWVAGWGLAAFVAGLVVLRYRSIAY